MVSKPKRNEPCPCGSGKKYKKCCLGISNTDSPNFTEQDFENFLLEAQRRITEKESVDAIPFFSSLNNLELLSSFALLQVLPQNHGKNIRLEEIQKQVVQSTSASEKTVDVTFLKNFIHEKFPHNHLEDPPENLFTENLMTPIGNMIVFPGITEGQVYYLQQLITTIFNSEDEFERDFKKEAINSTLLLLSMTDSIATSLGYVRNMLVEQDESNDIYFPHQEAIETKREYFIFSESDVLRFAKSIRANPDLLDVFILNERDKRLSGSESDSNPLIFHPIIKKESKLILASPATVVFAAINNIITTAIKFNCLSHLLSKYTELCWHQCNLALKKIGFVRTQDHFPKTDLPVKEALYMFDSNKVAYVMVKSDDGKRYNPSYPLSLHIDNKLDEQINERAKFISNKVANDSRFKNYKFHLLTIVVGIGRPVYFQLRPKLDTGQWRVLGFSLYDLNILYKSGKCHNLTLWNYSKALTINKLSTQFFLDNISYFIENEESFYSTDDKISDLMVSVGHALEFKADAIKRHDEHLSVFPNKNGFQLIPVTREVLPALLPVYSTRLVPGFPLMLNTPVLDKDLWIIPNNRFIEPKNNKDEFEIEICLAIAYWLHELSPMLKELVNLTYIKQILIKVSVIEAPNYYDLVEQVDKNRALFDEIACSLEEHELHCELNEYFYYYLYRNDNYAEKVLMQKVLVSLAELLHNKNIPTGLNPERIDSLLNKYIPFGPKKKLLLHLSDHDIRLSPMNVIGLRPLYPFEINRQLDGLGEALSTSPYKSKEDLNAQEKQKLINDVVFHFYTKLREILSRYRSEDLLRKLMVLYEASIQKREDYKFQATPKIECFKDYCDILDIISKQNRKHVQHTLSLRCLIEHVIAEPSSGDALFDVEGLDSALAYMHNIITWGFLSDELRFKIADINVSLLPSGRIGTDKDFSKRVIESFYQQKFTEDIDDAIESFHENFKPLEREKPNSKSNSKLEKAFADEFGIDLETFLTIVDNAALLALEKEDSCYTGLKETFINEIPGITKINSDVISQVVSTFSLFNRGKVENVSELGLKSEDFYPWRFNRALSYLRKPFILISSEDKEFVWFSARALFDFKFHLISQIQSGRHNAISPTMKSYIAEVNDKNGKDFNDKVFQHLKKEKDVGLVYPNVKIGPKGILRHNEDIGDIDILIINEENKSIIAIECKDIIVARTPYEMHLELMKFITGNKPWIPKVDKRNNWLKSNIKSLQLLHNDDYQQYSYEYIFLTSEAIPLPFIREEDISYRFVNFYDVRKNLGCLFQNTSIL
ncbi:YecA family protein [Nafulsella turpanensis]|uniref:YecA family protein n=1 Tax=Nafulsella turpanensis TaxID=1265690 RepID=UPI00034DF618|nr:SEC-C metal-binding domain-containing protein [Nafulsella turpanensis]